MRLFLSHAGIGEVSGGVERYAQYLKKIFRDLEIVDYHSLKSELGGTVLSPLKEPIRAKKLGDYVSKKFPGADAVFTNGMFCWNLNGSNQYNICHGTYAAFASAAVKNPLDFMRLRYIYSEFEKKAALNARKVVSNSRSTASSVYGFFGSDSEVIYPPVDTELFKPMEQEKCADYLNWGGTNVLFVGRPEYAKGFDFVQELARKNPKINFRCVLSRPHESIIENLHIMGQVEHSKLPIYYNAADLVLFPSRFEGFGFVTAESLSCNKKILCLRTGVAKEIAHGNLLVSEPDISELEKKMLEALKSKAQNSHALAEKTFSLDLFRKNWKNIVAE